MTIGSGSNISGLVSTIIPVYNRSELLREAVASVLAQTYPRIETIIVDDGSTDDTAAACDQLARNHPAVTVLHLPHQGRIGRAREAGRLVAKGEYIQYLDSDDLLLPTKFARMVEALEEHPECGIAYCYTRRYRRGDMPWDVPVELTGQTFHTMLPAFLSRRFWHTSTPLYRRSLCDEAGPWSDLLFWEDIEYDIRIATRNPQLYHCKEFLTDCRDHEMGRVGGSDRYDDPRQMSDASKAAGLIYQQVRNHGMTYADEDLRFFIDDVRMIHNRCRALGLAKEAQQCADIVSDATGADQRDWAGDFTVRATIEPQVTVLRAGPGQTASLSVRVVNQSTTTFRSGEFSLELSYHLLSIDGTMLQFDNPKRSFEEPLRPGEERVIDLAVPAPTTVGLYYLDLEILWAPGTWLKSTGNPTSIVKLVVGEDTRERKRWLKVEEGNEANLVSSSDHPDRVRIVISKALTTTAWHIQLNELSFSVRATHRYRIAFRARADQPRSMGFGVARAHQPWDDLGLYSKIELTSEWRSFAEEFVATEDDGNARILFDVGGSDTAVELASVRFRSLSDEQFREPPVFSLTARLQMDIGVKPLSYVWGTDRGLPVHRYYLEQFLAEFASHIRGHCLEFQNPAYTPRFGGSAVVTLDILHVDDSNPLATLVADLTKPNDLPTDHFDCIICTHVLQLILQVDKAVAELYRILKPGGVLLVAEPHISMNHPSFGHELWRFTPEGLAALLSGEFGQNNVTVRGYGNSLTAAGEIRGLVVNEFAQSELDIHDSWFAVEVCARAIKPG